MYLSSEDFAHSNSYCILVRLGPSILTVDDILNQQICLDFSFFRFCSQMLVHPKEIPLNKLIDLVCQHLLKRLVIKYVEK